jgi:hypothetical protein
MFMNEGYGALTGQLVDWAALELQRLHGEERLGGCNVLLRIDNRVEAAEAPFQFDPVNGLLHRRGCRAIPGGAQSALYGVWQIGPEEAGRACKRCRPVPGDNTAADEADRADLLFGLLSVVGQFASVLKERGRDYQKSSEGRKLSTQLSTFYRNLGQREKEVLDTVLGTLDQLVERLREANQTLHGARPAGERDD